MSPMERPLAILFVDIADSTKLYEALGNARAVELTRKMLFMLRGVIEANNGGVIKTLGDGLLAAFPSADGGARAALSMLEASRQATLKLRVGLSFGPVIQQSEDVYGDACNVAARVQAMARPGEALATEFLVERMSGALRAQAKLLNRIGLKGKAESILIYELRGEAADDAAAATVDATTIGVGATSGEAKRMTLTVSFRGRNYIVNRLQPRLSIGRDEISDIRVASRNSSRHHAQLDFSRESFILTDQSTNGTFIRAGNSPPLALRRDSTKLVGAGLIGFGAEPDDEGQDYVAAYRCDLE